MTTFRDVTKGYGDRATFPASVIEHDEDFRPSIEQWLDDDTFDKVVRDHGPDFADMMFREMAAATVGTILLTVAHEYKPHALRTFWTEVSCHADVVTAIMEAEIDVLPVIDLMLSGDHRHVPAELQLAWAWLRERTISRCTSWSFIQSIYGRQV